jgi:hypothetical protein
LKLILVCESLNNNDIKGCKDHGEELFTDDTGLADFESRWHDLLKHDNEAAGIVDRKTHADVKATETASAMEEQGTGLLQTQA